MPAESPLSLPISVLMPVTLLRGCDAVHVVTGDERCAGTVLRTSDGRPRLLMQGVTPDRLEGRPGRLRRSRVSTNVPPVNGPVALDGQRRPRSAGRGHSYNGAGPSLMAL